tara:strand:+ start:921 stop:1652 length:732 start_codon:yes stop_codon:yes gene_type:complete
MPEKINISLNEAEAKCFADEFGNNPELLLNEYKQRSKFPFSAKVIICCLGVALTAVWFVKDNEVKALQKGSADFCAQEISQSKIIADLNKEVGELRDLLVIPVSRGKDIAGLVDKLRPKDYWTRVNEVTGETRLHRAIINKENKKYTMGFEELEDALSLGADLNAQRFRRTDLGEAIKSDPNGQTPLMILIVKKRWNMLEYILEHHIEKVDKAVCNWNGKTAADFVLRHGGDDKRELYALLKN